MPVVCSTVVIKLNPQRLNDLRKSPLIYIKTRRDRRLRNDQAFNHVILKKPHSKIVFLVYANGKCVILSAKSPNEIISSTRWICRALHATLVTLPVVRNVVYVDKFCLDKHGTLQDMYTKLAITHHVTLEPELSPALIVDSQSCPCAKIMIFRTGKVNITGVKNFESLHLVLKEVDSLLNNH